MGREIVTYNPLEISIFIEKYYEEDVDEWKEKMLHCVDVLEDHLKERNGLLFIACKFPWPKYGLPANWISCMAQSSAIVAFHYAYFVAGNLTYEGISNRLTNAFFVEGERGVWLTT